MQCKDFLFKARRPAGNRLVFLLFYVSSNFLLSYFTVQYPEVLP